MTDRKDTRGIAQLLRMGWFRPVHAKSPQPQEVRALLVAQQAAADQVVGCGVQHPRHSARVRAEDGRSEQGPVCSAGARANDRTWRITEPMLRARDALWTEYSKLHGEVLALVKPDPMCRRLMTAPGVSRSNRHSMILDGSL
jgi:transposase